MYKSLQKAVTPEILEIHRKLDTIFASEQMLAYFNRQLYTLCLQLLHAKHVESERKAMGGSNDAPQVEGKINVAKVLEPYNITYHQYQALLIGKGKAEVALNFKRALERNSLNFDALLYSEKLIDQTMKSQAVNILEDAAD